MAETERLRRLIADEVGECCDGDVASRMERLEELTGAIPAEYDGDLDALGALSDDTRYRLVRVLAAAGGELCVCEVTPLVDVSDSAVSHALSDLADAGLVSRRKDGQWRYYESTDRAERLVAALDATRRDA
jgi:DNA-binding transcriptional ArsR family regulator